MFRGKTVHLALSLVFYSSLTVFGQRGTTSNLNGAYLLNSGVGFVVGDSGTILKTTDADMAWSPLTSGATNASHDRTGDKKRAERDRASDSFLQATLYGERNSEIVCPIRTRGIVRARESVSRHSTAIATDARGNYHDLRAAGGKGRAECRHSVYDANGLARADGLSIFR
jgi:hypothetical protein